MSPILWLFLPTILLLCLYLLHKSTKPPENRAPPGPPRLPFIGNLHQFLSAGNLPPYLHKLSLKYGPIIRLQLGSLPVVVVSSANLAKEVLKTQDVTFCNRPKFLGQQKLSYGRIDIAFSPYGDYWREARKITAVHLLSTKNNQSFRPIREEEVSRMIQKVLTRDSRIVDLSQMAVSLGSSLICRIAFGRGSKNRELRQRRFDGMLREAQAVLVAVSVADFFPALGWVDGVVGNRGWFERTFRDLDSFYQELIDEHLDKTREEEEEEEEEEKDVVDVLIQLKEERSLSFEFSWEHIKALLMVLVFEFISISYFISSAAADVLYVGQ